MGLHLLLLFGLACVGVRPMEPSRTIDGVVRDAAGPIADALVTAWAAGPELEHTRCPCVTLEDESIFASQCRCDAAFDTLLEAGRTLSARTPLTSTRSDAQGRFVLKGASSARTIWAEAGERGRAFARIKGTSATVDFSDAIPIGGLASLSLEEAWVVPLGADRAFRVTLDRYGRFALPPMSRAAHLIVAHGPSGLGREALIPGVSNALLILSSGRNAPQVVQLAGDAPVEALVITVGARRERLEARNGRFLLPPAWTEHDVHLATPDCAWAGVARGGHLPETLRRTITREGVVRGPDGASVEGAEVELDGLVTKTDAEGRFRFACLSPDKTYAVARAMGLSGVERIEPGSPRSLEISLTTKKPLAKAPWLRGTEQVEGEVRVYGRPAAFAVIEVNGCGVNQGWQTTADAGGHFRVAELPPATCTITARIGEFETTNGWPTRSLQTRVDTTVRVPVSLDVAPGVPVTGVVVDVRGRPVSGARVFVRASRPDRRVGNSVGVIASAESGDDGTFTITDAPEGLVDATVAPLEGYLVEAPVASVSDAKSPLRLVLPPLRRVRGRVLEPGGAPARRVAVFNHWYGVFDDGSGKFEFPLFTEQESFVTLAVEGFQSLKVPLPATDEDLELGDLTVAPARSVRVHLVDENGRALEALSIDMSSGVWERRVTDDDGYAVFADVPLAPLDVHVWGRKRSLRTVVPADVRELEVIVPAAPPAAE